MPQMPELLAMGQHEYPDSLFELEDHWSDFMDIDQKVSNYRISMHTCTRKYVNGNIYASMHLYTLKYGMPKR